MFICCMVLHCAGTQIESGSVSADLTTTAVYSYKLLINDVKPIRSLELISIINLQEIYKEG